MITIKPFILTALLLFTATVKAEFGTLDIALYGTPTSTFWQHHYYHNSTDSVTHTGIDMQVGANTSHVEIDSYGFGQVVNINSGMGAVTIRHLIDTGEWINVNLLHLHSGSIAVSTADYIAKGQLLGREGNTGLGQANRDSNTHLHLEVAGQVSLAWVPTVEACPGPGCNSSERTSSFDYQTMNAHYRISGQNSRHIPFNNRVWYDPQILQDHKEALPYLSQTQASPSFANYDVFARSNRPVNGCLAISGRFQQSSIVVRDFTDRSNVLSRGGLDYEQRFLSGTNENSAVNGLCGSKQYAVGDYLFVAYVMDENEQRFGYPVKFSVVGPNDMIIDNDQYNADSSSLNDRTSELTYNGTPGAKVPGYYVSADLHHGQSGAFAQWKPFSSGTYKVFVHIPEQGATAEAVRYVIKTDGQSETISNPIDQAGNSGKWVQLKANQASTFELNSLGYVGISLDNQAYNLDVPAASLVAFDAVKFERVEDNSFPWTMLYSAMHSRGLIPTPALELGTGDLRVTLMWNNTSDMDLHVIEPSGNRVYYGSTEGDSAELDVDDTDGYGPENIFVPPGQANEGLYQIYVDHYLGNTATDISVTVVVFENTNRERRYTSTLRLQQGDYSPIMNIRFPEGTAETIEGITNVF